MSLTISFKLSLIPITQTQDYAARRLPKESKSFFLLSSISFISKECLNPHKELPQAVDEAIKSSYLYSPIIKIIFFIQRTQVLLKMANRHAAVEVRPCKPVAQRGMVHHVNSLRSVAPYFFQAEHDPQHEPMHVVSWVVPNKKQGCLFFKGCILCAFLDPIVPSVLCQIHVSFFQAHALLIIIIIIFILRINI